MLQQGRAKEKGEQDFDEAKTAKSEVIVSTLMNLLEAPISSVAGMELGY